MLVQQTGPHGCFRMTYFGTRDVDAKTHAYVIPSFVPYVLRRFPLLSDRNTGCMALFPSKNSESSTPQELARTFKTIIFFVQLQNVCFSSRFWYVPEISYDEVALIEFCLFSCQGVARGSGFGRCHCLLSSSSPRTKNSWQENEPAYLTLKV